MKHTHLTISILAVIIIFSAGCRNGAEITAGPASTSPLVAEGPGARYVHDTLATAETTELYRVGARDRIQLFVARHPEFEGKLLVDPRGRVTLPTAEREISVSGLNAVQIARKIAMEIRSYVVRAPQVRVELLETSSKSYYVVGGVNRPGKYSIGMVPVTVKDALLAAGLPGGGDGVGEIQLIKADPVKPISVSLDSASLLKGDLGLDVTLRDGDIIFVPTSTYSQINRLQVDLELHLERGASTENLHRFIHENLRGLTIR